MKIPLFDIDWTILKGGNPIHRKAFLHAYKKSVDVSGREKSIEGQIDNEIILDFMQRHGKKITNIKAKINEATKTMSEFFLEHSDETRYTLIPETKSLLKVLKTEGIPCGILTGNVETIGREKLTKSGIKDFFSFGAFGDQGFRREDLIKIAENNAKEVLKNKALSEKNFILIGDSLLDVVCAKKGGIKIIAVAQNP